MRGLRSALYKDIRLFLRGGGLLALLLPLLLLPALRWGMADLVGQSYVRSFPIAVRDLDGTVMSRSLTSQLGQIELFSQIEVLDPTESDEVALDRGVAAVITVPQDFFYELYTMSDCPVTVTINENMALEGALMEAIVTSIMDIVRADQAAYVGVYSFVYGDGARELTGALYSDTADRLFQDALGRQQVFSQTAQAADLAASLSRRLLACVLAVTAIFFALSAVKTLPEEIELGVLPRFRAAGGRLGAFLLSKLCTAFLLTLPELALGAALFPGVGFGMLLTLDVLLLTAAFGMLTAVAAWTGSPGAAQRWGNILLLISLALGGTLWSRTALPGPLAWLGKLTLPYYAALGLDARAQGWGYFQTLAMLWPLPVMGGLGLVLAAPGFRQGRGHRGALPVSGTPGPALPEPDKMPRRGFFRRLTGLGCFKLRAMAGGAWALIAVIGVSALCGWAAASARQGGARELHVAVCDLDGTALSAELGQAVAGEKGVSAGFYTLEDARRALLTGELEGILVIEPGYADGLKAGSGEALLRYESAGASVAAQGAREIAGGKSAAQRSRLMAVELAGTMLGRALTEEETDLLYEAIHRAEEDLPPLYVINRAGGSSGTEPFQPGQMSFAALAALFTLFTAASWCGSAAGRLVERRMGVMAGGRTLSYDSDWLGLTALGLAVMLAALLPGGMSFGQLAAAAAYALAASALALLLTRFTALAGRVDALAPFLALLICLLGGCFVDLTELSPVMETASLISPAGLAVRAADGRAWATAALLGEGAVLFVLGLPRAKR